jgi:Leucine-rich repeat (LRR) protein
LEHLRLANNQIEAIDLSKNINLKVVDLSNNKLVTVPKFPANRILKSIDLRHNLLKRDDWVDIQNIVKKMPRPKFVQNDHLISGFAYSIANATDMVKPINSAATELTN